MAQFEPAYEWLMQDEDAANAHAIVPDACPDGCQGPCYAISGINSGAWPDAYAVIAATPQAQRGPLVSTFYDTHYWNQWLAQLNSQDLANRVFDFSVNGGAQTEVKVLQRAINASRGSNVIADDGLWGPATVAAANSCYQVALLTAFGFAQLARYDAIEAANPSLAKYAAVWRARAMR